MGKASKLLLLLSGGTYTHTKSKNDELKQGKKEHLSRKVECTRNTIPLLDTLDAIHFLLTLTARNNKFNFSSYTDGILSDLLHYPVYDNNYEYYAVNEEKN